MGTDEQVRVGGAWLTGLAPWGDLSYSSRWGDGGGGCEEASWSVYLPPLARLAVLRRGALCEVYSGATRIWLGTVGKVNWADGTITADGLYKRANDFYALDGSGNATSIANTAIDAAIADGLEWTRPASISSTALTASAPDNINTLASLLDMTGDRDGKRWAVFEDGAITMAADATTPTWQIAPGIVDLGEDDTDYAAVLKVRYIDSGTSAYTTLSPNPTDAAAVALFGVRQGSVDLTPAGPISAATAAQYGAGILAKGRARMGWANEITVGPDELTTWGGQAGDLSMVRAGQVVRAFGIYDPFSATPYRDLVIGKCARSLGDGGGRSVTLSPVDTQPQSLTDVVDAVMTAALKKPFTA